MKKSSRLFVFTLGSLIVTSTAAAQTVPDSLPPGVTAAMLTEGAALFTGPGTCFACHGQDAKGVPNLGADLTDDEWTHATGGTYEKIIETIMKGAQGSSGAVMPPKGGSSISDEQVKAVAAYVWSLSRVGD